MPGLASEHYSSPTQTKKVKELHLHSTLATTVRRGSDSLEPEGYSRDEPEQKGSLKQCRGNLHEVGAGRVGERQPECDESQGEESARQRTGHGNVELGRPVRYERLELQERAGVDLALLFPLFLSEELNDVELGRPVTYEELEVQERAEICLALPFYPFEPDRNSMTSNLEVRSGTRDLNCKSE